MQNIIGVFRMRQSVKSKGGFYEEMAAEVEPFTESGGPAAAKAARFLAEAVNLAFREKLIRQQHALFECATSMADVETAVALVRAAASTNDRLLKAQSRVWAADVALGGATRLLKLFGASGVLDPTAFEALRGKADLESLYAMQSGRLADMDFIAQQITGQDIKP
jgi:alkylation response protein AidB-like acyl-CoA dehydrogenase